MCYLKIKAGSIVHVNKNIIPTYLIKDNKSEVSSID